ncbi:ladderlectin-like [Cheilinus undulatus]|uniref:ladderlectin-like n=1 Tax=Cheilinus undulatus TaxID=241271 RepID=UPI001BD66A1B|nr:ladderlectin-like [Cheilinus undulatus]
MLLLLSLLGLALAAASPLDEPDFKLQRGDCPMFWYSFNGGCYKYVATAKTWAKASLNCEEQRSGLVSIHSMEEQNFVTALIRRFDPSEGSTWIGLTDIGIDGYWIWSNGKRVTFTFWRDGEPNGHEYENCAVTNYKSSPRWSDISCTYTHPSVCASFPH